MSGAIEGVDQIARFSTMVMHRSTVFLVCFIGVVLRIGAQEVPSKATSCFDVKVRLNGNLLDGPSSVTLFGPGIQMTVGKEGGCFHVPPEMRTLGETDLSLTVAKESLYFLRIPVARLHTLLDVEIEDKKFSFYVKVPKGAKVKQSCNVVVHDGDAEPVFFYPYCRKTFE
jgi:hypothetical protein